MGKRLPAAEGLARRVTLTVLTVRGGVAAVEQMPNDLKAMSAIVGGYVEHVSLRGRFHGLHLWVNEQGHLEQLPTWMTPFYPQPLAGDFFLTRLDPAGETTSLEPADIALLKSVLP